ncbi:protein c19orf12 [Plakobranchus ocellatus]|uniref:Protein c19orf12 n=1 Tax=Plakobranchus ocellatus TaxID=259542 RepID=A0AAV4AHM2_9GAST|nr:protein c19orf12 [Plakobranchus ocellatus]
MFKNAALGAYGAWLGAVMLGPVGAVVGGAAGSWLGYRYSDDYQPLGKVMADLSDDDKEEIVKKIQELVGDLSFTALARYAMESQDQRVALLNLIINEIKKRR